MKPPDIRWSQNSPTISPLNQPPFRLNRRRAKFVIIGQEKPDKGPKRLLIGAQTGCFESKFRTRSRTKKAHSHVSESICRAAILPGEPIKDTVDIQKMRLGMFRKRVGEGEDTPVRFVLASG